MTLATLATTNRWSLSEMTEVLAHHPLHWRKVAPCRWWAILLNLNLISHVSPMFTQFGAWSGYFRGFTRPQMLNQENHRKSRHVKAAFTFGKPGFKWSYIWLPYGSHMAMIWGWWFLWRWSRPSPCPSDRSAAESVRSPGWSFASIPLTSEDRVHTLW